MAGGSNNYTLPYSGSVDSYSSTAIDTSYALSSADLVSSTADMSTIIQTQSSTITVTRNDQSNSSEGSPEQRTSSYEPSTILTLPCSDCSDLATVVTGVVYATSEDLTTTITGEITSLVVVTLFRDGEYLIAPTGNALPLSRSVTVDAVRGSPSDEVSEPGLEADLLLPSNYLVDSPEINTFTPPDSALPLTSTWSLPVGSLNYITEIEDYSSLTPNESSADIDMSLFEPVSAEETVLILSSDMTGSPNSPSVTEIVGISTPIRASSSMVIPISTELSTADGIQTSVSDATGTLEDSETAETEVSAGIEMLQEPGPVEVSTMSQETEPVEEGSTADRTATLSYAGSSDDIEMLTETGAPKETGTLETEMGNLGFDTLDIDISRMTEITNTDMTAMTESSVETDTSNEIATSESVTSETDVTNETNTPVTNSIPDDTATSEINTPQTDAPDLDATEALDPEANTSRVADALIGTETFGTSDSSGSYNSDVTTAPENYINPSEPSAVGASFSVGNDISNSYSVTTDENFALDTITPSVTGMQEQISTLDELTGSVDTDSSEETEFTEVMVTPDETVPFEEMEPSDVEEVFQETEEISLTATSVVMEGSSEGSPTDLSESSRDIAVPEGTLTLTPTAESGTLVSSDNVTGSGETTVSTGPDNSEESVSSESLPSTALTANLEESQLLEASETSEVPASVEETSGSTTSEGSGESESDEESELIAESRTPEETGLSQTFAIMDSSEVETLAETAFPLEETQTVEESLVSAELSILEESNSVSTPSSVTATIEGSDETEEPSSVTASSIVGEMSSDEDESSTPMIIPERTESSTVSTRALQSTDAGDSDVSETMSASTEAEESEDLLQLTGSPSEGSEVRTTSGSAIPTLAQIALQTVSDNMTTTSSENEMSSTSSTDATILSTIISSTANATAPSPSTAVEYMMSQSMSDNPNFSSSIEVDAADNSTSATPDSLVADADSPTSLMSSMASPQSTSTVTRTAISTLTTSTNETMESIRSEAVISNMTVSNSTLRGGGGSASNNNNGTSNDSAGTTDYGPLTTSSESSPMGTGSVPAMYASGSLNLMKARLNIVVLSFSAAAIVFAQ